MADIFERLFSLHSKTALITGAGGGIGRVLAVALAQAGATVGLHDLTQAHLTESITLVEAAGGRAIPFTANLGDLAACRQLIADAHAALGRLDILVNCAATNRRKPIAAVTVADFDLITAVNLRSIYFLCQAAQPIMQTQGGGKIINISSINSFFGLGSVSVYGLTKGAVTQLTRVMAVEWAKDNIQVNAIAPGFMATPLSQPVWADQHKAAWLRSRIPQRRPGQPEELVGVLLLLASAASTYITGQTLVVDGGFLAGGSWEDG
jgi:NAD(P)-dependent dehydrogenase (short-subunit alcohol dehydrogenase family)